MTDLYILLYADLGFPGQQLCALKRQLCRSQESGMFVKNVVTAALTALL